MRQDPKTGEVQVIDPVCGMEIDEHRAAAVFEYEGTPYYFCSLACKERFEEDPDNYL
ncbi:MAG TPA: YHS domain-containing protein [Dehalococcoidia bacterium]|nr:YHS domain-containing protein [Dehalococcoidia bacterium]